MENKHVHTGIVHFVFAGVSAIVFIQVMRLVAARLAQNERTQGIAATIGGLVSFPESR